MAFVPYNETEAVGRFNRHLGRSHQIGQCRLNGGAARPNYKFLKRRVQEVNATYNQSMKREDHIFVGAAVATALFCILFLCRLGWPISITASITLLVAWWWVTEPISIPATSLIPLALFPFLGIITADEAAAAYGSQLVQLMFGGLLLSAGMEKSGAHRRIALAMVNLCGANSGKRLVFGFMLACGR